MLKTEFAKPITVDEVIRLHEKYGMTLEINDGIVTSADFDKKEV